MKFLWKILLRFLKKLWYSFPFLDIYLKKRKTLSEKNLWTSMLIRWEKEIAIHSSILAWRILWTEKPGGLLSMESNRVRHDLKRLSMHACVGEGNGNPLQYSCLENPRDRGAWWAAVYGVAQSWTRLKWFSSSRMVIVWLMPTPYQMAA